MKIIKLTGGYLDNNNYIVIDGGEAVLIDASVSVDEIDNALDGAKLKAVLITHGHYDHISSLREILDKYHVKCYMSEKALPKLTDEHLNCSDLSEYKVICDIPRDDITLVREGDVLDLLNTHIEVIETPGHTDCGVTYVIGNNMFTGDTLFKGCVGRYDLPTSSRSSLVVSVVKLMKKGDYIVYPGHGESTSIQNERRN